MTVCFFGAHVKLEVSQLLDEVHSLIQRKGIRFILSGSSPRKLKRYGANLLGGRASKIQLFPFVSAEIPDFNIIRAVNNGMIPRHYMAKNPWERFQAYILFTLMKKSGKKLFLAICKFSRILWK